jgi:tRNA threonylcarbamoyladenosine biosynthesis protein TsaB
MSKILALDSSTDACSVALYCDGNMLHKFELAAKSHTQRLLPMVDEILQEGGLTLRDIDAIAYGRGPGSFTGLRICMGIVQGLAFGADIPVIPVSTLQAMAAGFAAQHPEIRLPLVVALDARMDEVYWGLFTADAQPIGEEHVMKPGLVVERSEVQALQRQFVALGPGWHYGELSGLIPEHQQQDLYPSAESIAVLGAAALDRGEQVSILDAQPVYLRDSVSWQKRERIRTQPL